MAAYVQGVLSLNAYDLDGQTVLYRVDVNSPLNPVDKTLLDDSRLKTIKPTLDKLSNSKVIILTKNILFITLYTYVSYIMYNIDI